ncbi:helix-turn-helix transcriptional regulator [uncultured Megasphaera sp.]
MYPDSISESSRGINSQGREIIMVQYTDRLKYLRISNNLSQKDVANLLGCSQVAYGMYELGKRRISLEKLIILAKYYNTTLDYIAGLSDKK